MVIKFSFQTAWSPDSELSVCCQGACVSAEGVVRIFYLYGWQGCILSCCFTVATDQNQQRISGMRYFHVSPWKIACFCCLERAGEIFHEICLKMISEKGKMCHKYGSRS